MLRKPLATLTMIFAMTCSGMSQEKFTSEQLAYLNRNPLLLALQKADPDGLGRVLDLLVAHANEQKRTKSKSRLIPNRRPEPEIDISGNPDLIELQKSSPEAAHELFLLLKQAGSIKTKK